MYPQIVTANILICYKDIHICMRASAPQHETLRVILQLYFLCIYFIKSEIACTKNTSYFHMKK